MRNNKRIGVFFFLLACLPIGCKSFEHLTRVDTVFPRAQNCSECHIDIHAEWTKSGHARAFIAEDFQAVTDRGSIADCITCHAPEPYVSDQPPLRRAAFPEEGVTCTTCHLSEGEMLGPVPPTGLVQPHPIQVRPAQYVDAALCARCHQGTYQQWQQSPPADKQTCQQCHMPRIDRKVTQATDSVSSFLVSFEKIVPQRRHTFVIPASDSNSTMFDLNPSFPAGQVAIELINRTPHSLPTGDYGFQVGRIEVAFWDVNHQEISREQAELIQELKTQLISGQSRQWTFARPPSATGVKVRLLRCGRCPQNTTELLVREIAIP